MSDQLIYEINGKKYILIEIPKIIGHVREMNDLVKKYGMVFQGIKSIDRGSWFSPAIVIEKYFLPEENFIAYSTNNL